MSGSDPTGFSWLSDILNGNSSSGWEGSSFFGAALGVIGGAYITSLAQAGAFAQGGSLSGFTGTSGLGGGAAIVEAFAGLNDPGANETYAAPTGDLGSGAWSQGGLYNENAGAAPPGAQGGMACYPGCLPDPRSAFPSEEAYQAWLDGVWISSNAILAAEGLVSVGGSLGRWLLGRGAASAAARGLPTLMRQDARGSHWPPSRYSRCKRAAAFENFAAQITKATNGQWSAKAFNATNARVFAGEGGEALVFDNAGNMFRGNLSDRAAFAFRDGGQIEVIFSALRGL